MVDKYLRIIMSFAFCIHYTCSAVSLKGTIRDHKFQTPLFSEPPDFLLNIQRELFCNILPIQQFSLKQHIFGKETILCRWEFIFASKKLIQSSVSSKLII